MYCIATYIDTGKTFSCPDLAISPSPILRLLTPSRKAALYFYINSDRHTENLEQFCTSFQLHRAFWFDSAQL